MGLKKTKLIYWLRVITAIFIYAITNAFDYFMTVEGIMAKGESYEANPIMIYYIRFFGLKAGVLTYKSILCILIVAGILILDFVYENKKRKSRDFPISLYFLYLGSILTVFAGFTWLL